MKHNSENLGFTQCLKRNPMECVHECKAQLQSHYCLSIYLMLNTVREKKGSQNPRIYSDFIIQAPHYPSRICKWAVSLSFSCFLVSVKNGALKFKKNKINAGSWISYNGFSVHHLIKGTHCLVNNNNKSQSALTQEPILFSSGKLHGHSSILLKGYCFVKDLGMIVPLLSSSDHLSGAATSRTPWKLATHNQSS